MTGTVTPWQVAGDTEALSILEDWLTMQVPMAPVSAGVQAGVGVVPADAHLEVMQVVEAEEPVELALILPVVLLDKVATVWL